MKSILLFLCWWTIPLVSSTQVGIGTSNVLPSAKLQVESTTSGFLPPRMTMTQRDAIQNPVNGLIIFNTSTGCLDYYHNGWYQLCGTSATLSGQYITGSIFCSSGPTQINEVINPATGKIWMDRNIGATQVATSSTDIASYGDLFQWGRKAEGHQCRNSPTIVGPNNSSGKFIIPTGLPYDWKATRDDNLWQGVSGTNNPCPAGFRVPTEAEWLSERSTWGGMGGINSPLRLPSGGSRYHLDGAIYNSGTWGYYWTSTIDGSSARYLYINSSSSGPGTEYRAQGYSVRCIKN